MKLDLKIRNHRLNIIWLGIGLVIVFLFFNLLLKWWNRDVVSVKVAKVEVGTIEAVVSATGIVDAPVYELGTKFGGRIADLKVREGQQVSRGQLLATFDNYEEAKNNFERAKMLYADGAVSRQSLDSAKTIFESSRIVSPAKGIVGKINYLEGETVVPGSTAIVVVNYDRSWVEAQIDEIDIAEVKVGDKAKITTDVYPNKVFLGEVYWIAPLAELRKVGGRIKMDEESYVFPCKIRFLGDHEELKVNMSVNVDIITESKEKAVLIPKQALITKADSSFVFVVNNRRAYETKIEVGIRAYGTVEVVSGVSPGSQVAVTNVARLKDQRRVKIER